VLFDPGKLRAARPQAPYISLPPKVDEVAGATAEVPHKLRAAIEWAQVTDGALVACRTSPIVPPDLIAHPAWARVRELETGSHALATSATLTTLERATLTGAALSELAGRSEPASVIVSFGSRGPLAIGGIPIRIGAAFDKRKDWKDALAVGALVNLRAISITLAEDPRQRLARGDAPLELGPAWFWSSPLAAQLQALDAAVGSSHHALAGWLEHLAALPGLQRIIVRALHTGTSVADLALLSFVIDRSDAGPAITIQSSIVPSNNHPIVATLAHYLAGFPRGARASFELVAGTLPPICDDVRACLGGWFDRVELADRTRHIEL
jgi:hypothetical protein